MSISVHTALRGATDIAGVPTGTQAGPGLRSRNGHSDSLQISSSAAGLSSALNLHASQRAERLQSIRAALASGTYAVNTRTVASTIVATAMGEPW